MSHNISLLAPSSFRRSPLYRFKGIKPRPQQYRPRFVVAESEFSFPRRKSGPFNILFCYLYRDASNYKQYGETIFTNHHFLALTEIEQQIRSFLSEGQYFIAQQVHIEERFFDALYDDDHPWHEFDRIEATTLAPFDPDNWAVFKHRRDITEFIADVTRAHTSGWDETKVRWDVKALRKKSSGESPC